MNWKNPLTDDRLKTPRAAAVADIVFSVLFIISLVLIRTAVPADPQADEDLWPVTPPPLNQYVPEFQP